jgi:hypothetical protein
MTYENIYFLIVITFKWEVGEKGAMCHNTPGSVKTLPLF